MMEYEKSEALISSKKNGKILMVNESNKSNYGDKAIHFTISKLFGHYEQDFTPFSYPVFKFKKNTLFTNYLEYFFFFISHFIKVFRLKYKNYDQIVIGGGQLIRNNIKFSISLFVFTLLHKNVKLICVGCDKDFHKIVLRLNKFSLKRINEIVLRDENSEKNFKAMYHSKVTKLYDVVFLINKYYDSKQENISHKNYNAIFLQNYEAIKRNDSDLSKEDYLYICKNNIIENSNGKDRLLIVNSTSSDGLFVEEYMSLIDDKTKKLIDVFTVNSFDDFIQVVINCKKVISNRMHPLIIGYSFGKELQTITSSNKLKGFKEEFEMNLSSKLEDIQLEILDYFGQTNLKK